MAAACREHGLVATLFCETCRAVTCTRCMLSSSHVGHSCSPVEVALKEVQERIRAKAETLERNKKLLEHFVRHLDGLSSGVRSDSHKTVASVRARIDLMRSALQRREKELLGLLAEAEKREIDRIEAKERRLRARHQAMHEALGAAAAALAVSDPATFFEGRNIHDIEQNVTRLVAAPQEDLSYTPGEDFERTMSIVGQQMRFFGNIDAVNGNPVMTQYPGSGGSRPASSGSSATHIHNTPLSAGGRGSRNSPVSVGGSSGVEVGTGKRVSVASLATLSGLTVDDEDDGQSSAAAAATFASASASGLSFGLDASLDIHEDMVSALAVDGSGKAPVVYSASRDGAIKAWDTRTQAVGSFGVDKGGVSALLVVDGYLYSGGGDTVVKRWDLGAREVDLLFKGHSGQVSALAVAGVYVLSGSHDRSVRVWDLEENCCASVFTGHLDAVSSLAVLGPSVFSGSHDKTVRQWSLETFTCVHVFHGHTSYVRAVAVDDRWLFSGSDDLSIRVWDIATRACLYTLVGHTAAVRALAVAGARLFSGSDDAHVRVWDLYRLQTTQQISGHSLSVTQVCYERGVLYTASRDRTIKRWSEAEK